MITSNVLQRVYSIKRGDKSATAFTIDIDQKQYFISSHHMFSDVSDSVGIQIFHQSRWKNLNLTLIGHCQGEIDISVFTANIQLTPIFPCEPTSAGLMLGQDVFFLGFPFGEYGDAGTINRDFPLPFVKKATLSCIQFKDNKQILFLDGFNNPGFSGGPVVFSAPNKFEYKLCGVISGYRSSAQPVYQGNVQLPIYYWENSGIVISYGIMHAIDVIKANPIGFTLSGG